MKTETDRMLEEGGLFTDGMDVDPVSGNEVPPGSNAEDVRDDIPAMLSPNEYVVPADVLRFYGVKFFEDLRAEAKMGLAGMEANGRIGGEPVMEDELPFSDEELMAMDMPDTEEVAAAKGGLMGFQEGGLNFPAYIKQPDLSFMGGTGGGSGLEYRKYVNEAGMTITIPFFDGEPMGMIPPGYTPEGATPAATEEDGTGGVTDTGEDIGGSEFTGGTGEREPTIPVEDMNAAQVTEALGKTFDPDSFLAKAGVAAAAVFGGPMIGLAARGISKMNANQREALESQAKALGIDLESIDDFGQDLTRENFKDKESFTNAMKSVAPPGMSYDEDEGGYTRDDRDPEEDFLGGTYKETTDEGVVVYDAGETTIKPPSIPNRRNTSDSSDDRDISSDTSNVGNYGGDRDGDGVPNAIDFDDGVGWADRSKD